jgi:hypothetical protein
MPPCAEGGPKIPGNSASDESLTWTPPGECVTGLDLPVRESDDIDLTALDQLVNQQHVAVTEARVAGASMVEALLSLVCFGRPG